MCFPYMEGNEAETEVFTPIAQASVALYHSMKKKSFPNFLSNSKALEVARMHCEAIPCEYDANSR